MQEISPLTAKSLYTAQFSKILRTPWTPFVGVILVLVGTIKHSVLLYLSLFEAEWGPDPGFWTYCHAAIFLISIDVGAVIFAAHGHKSASAIFSFLIGVLNLYFFWTPLTFPGWSFSLDWLPFLPGLLYAGLLAFCLYFFTELFVGYFQRDQALLDMEQAMVEARKAEVSLRKELNQQLATHRKELLSQEAQREALRQQLETQRQDSEAPATGVEKQALLPEVLADVLSCQGKSPENLRKSAAYWRKKLEEDSLSAEARAQGEYRLALFEGIRKPG